MRRIVVVREAVERRFAVPARRGVPNGDVHLGDDAAVFSALALATAGALAMPMGAILMNQMGHYVGALAAASAHQGFVLALAWHPWAVIRIVSFVTIGVVLSTPLLSRLGRFTVDGSQARRLLAWAIAGLVTDIVTKSLFAPLWQALLLHLTGW